MIDIKQLLSVSTVIYSFVILQSLIVLFSALNVYKKRRLESEQTVVRPFLVFSVIVLVFLVWYLLTILNYSFTCRICSLWGTRLAFAIVPWVIFGIILLFREISGKNKYTFLYKLALTFTFILSGLALMDQQVVKDSIPHVVTGARDVPVFGKHIVLFLGVLLGLVGSLITLVFRIYKEEKNKVLKARYKIIISSFLAGLVVILSLNLFLPSLGHPELIDYGVLSSLFVIYGIYVALEDKWVYSVKYLLASNLITWIVGLILFVSVKLIEIVMAYVFHLGVVNIKDLNAQLFGLLLGIGVAYSLDLLYKFSHGLGLKIFYPRYYKFKKDLDVFLYKGTYNKSPQKVVLKNILMLFVNTFNICKACIFEKDALYTDDYKVCVENHETNVFKKKKDLQKIQIKLMKNRFLNFYTDNKFIPKEFVDLIKLRRASINALVNLDITSENLKTINTRLAKAVVTRTKKLDSIIEKQRKVIKDLKIELLRLKGFLPDIIKNMSFSSNAIKQYLVGLLKQTQGNKDLQFIVDKLYNNVKSLLQDTQELMIFTDVVANGRLLKEQADFRVFVEQIIDEWQVRYENKMVGLIKDIFTQHIKVTADYEKIKYILDFVLGTMLRQLSHGYVQAIGRIEGGYVRLRFIAKITDNSAVPIVDKEQEEMLRKKLFLVASIVKLHGGLFSHSFENGFLSFIEFTLPISGI